MFRVVVDAMKLFIAELKRRNVTRVAVAYVAAAWLLIEVADTTLPRFGFSDLAVRNFIILAAIGFIPTLVISWFFELTPDGFRADVDANLDAASSSQSNKRTDRLIVILLLCTVGVLAFDKFLLDPVRDAARIDDATEAARAGAMLDSYGDKSIAVLAFSDMSPSRDQEYLSDGIAEELLNLLTPIKDLRVISRSSAFSFKGSGATIPEIAEKLSVSYVLEGSVRKSGNNIRITAQLIDARTDTHIWSETYNRTLDDVFAVQDEISGAIVEKLKLAMLDDRPRFQEVDPYAYELYLKAQFIIHTGNWSQLREAQSMLNEALAIAPDYIPALNALARLYYRIPKIDGLSMEQNRAEIKALADRVIAIDPDGISSQIWQGYLANQAGDLQSAAEFYEKALSIDPGNTSLLRVLTVFLHNIGRPDDAIALGHYLLLRDPACATCIGNLAFVYRSIGEPEKSAKVLESTLSWHAPGAGFYWSLGTSWLVAGRPQQALDAFEKEVLVGNREMGTLMALHDLGRIEEFDSRFSTFRNDASTSAEAVARIYAWVGDNDNAFAWIDRMIEVDGPAMLFAIDTDLYARIKSDPRWKRLRSEHGIEDVTPLSIDFSYSLPAGAARRLFESE